MLPGFEWDEAGLRRASEEEARLPVGKSGEWHNDKIRAFEILRLHQIGDEGYRLNGFAWEWESGAAKKPRRERSVSRRGRVGPRKKRGRESLAQHTQTHLVGEDAVEAIIVKRYQPLEARHLMVFQSEWAWPGLER